MPAAGEIFEICTLGCHFYRYFRHIIDFQAVNKRVKNGCRRRSFDVGPPVTCLFQERDNSKQVEIK